MKQQAFNPYLSGCEYIPDRKLCMFNVRVDAFNESGIAEGGVHNAARQ
jgi:hypothetical protein